MKKRIIAALLAAVLLASASISALAAPESGIAASGFCVTSDGSLLIADAYNRALWKQSGDQQTVRIAGRESVRNVSGAPLGGYFDGAADKAAFQTPWAITPFLSGWAVSDTDNHVIRFWDGKTVRTAAGSGKSGFTDGTGVKAQFSRPTGLATGADGSVYIADTDNHVIRQMDKTGKVTIFAGSTEGCADGAARTAAKFREPTGLCVSGGALYVADSGNHRICKIENGVVTTVAGSAAGESGDLNGAAATARLSYPQGVAVSGSVVYIADTGNGCIRKLENGAVSTLCKEASLGSGLYPAEPRALAVQGDRLYVGDVFARTVFYVNPGKTQTFSDVQNNAWYAEAVESVSAMGLMSGSGGRFNPTGKLDRAMCVTILSRLEANINSGASIDGKTAFADVPADAYYAKAAAWAADQELVKGVGNGKFAPSRGVTRQEFATMLYHYAVHAGKGPVGDWAIRLTYTDTEQIADWATEAAMWCQMKGIVTGKTGGRFDPSGQLTRAEAAAMFQRLIEQIS